MSDTITEFVATPVSRKFSVGDRVKSAWEWLSKSRQKAEQSAGDRTILYQGLEKVIDGPVVKDRDLKRRVRDALHNGNKEITQALAYHLTAELFQRLQGKGIDPNLKKQLAAQKNLATKLATDMDEQIREEGRYSRASIANSDEAWEKLLTSPLKML